MPIKFNIYPGGHVRIEPQGYEGATCSEATKPYTDRLAGEQHRTEGEAEQTVKTDQVVQSPQQQKAGQ